MSAKYFDTHAHYCYRGKRYKEFQKNCHEILAQAHVQGVLKILNASIEIDSNLAMIKEFENYPYAEAVSENLPEIYVALGEHPTAVGSAQEAHLDEEKDRLLESLCGHPRVRAIKTGLDYHYGMGNVTRQQVRFRKLIRLALRENLPLVLHIRDAHADALRILEEESAGKTYRGVIHCFIEGTSIAGKFIEMGFVLGIGGKVTWPENTALRKAVQDIPLQYLVLETDCPFIPVYGRKETNTSMDIPKIAEEIAELKHISLEEVAEKTWENAEELFRRNK